MLNLYKKDSFLEQGLSFSSNLSKTPVDSIFPEVMTIERLSIDSLIKLQEFGSRWSILNADMPELNVDLSSLVKEYILFPYKEKT